MKPTFYCINRCEGKNQIAIDLLQSACEKQGIKFTLIDAEKADFADLPKPTSKDAVYNLSRTSRSRRIEQQLVHARVKSFYKNPMTAIVKPDNVIDGTLIMEKAGVPIIPTVYGLPRGKAQAESTAKALNGFPLVIKTIGGMHGIGVIKTDSMDSFSSLCDYLSKQGVPGIIRAFIKHKRQGRLIVLGKKVIASHENLVGQDFRTNAGDNSARKRRIVTYPKPVQAIAVKAVQSLGFEFGGVDILFDQKGRPFVAEVNIPCYFTTTQQLTGIDIALAMIKHLFPARR